MMKEKEKLNEYKDCKICNSTIRLINPKFNLVQCEKCKLVFCKTIFTQQNFINVYNNLYNNTNQYKVHIKEFENLKNGRPIRIGKVKREILNFLKKREAKSIVEIGAGVGTAAGYFQTHKINYKGIELDEQTVERAQSIGLPIISGDFKLLKTLEGKFNGVIAFEVVEHLQELDVLFLILKEKLELGGYFGFTVPNYDKRKNFKQPNNKIYQSPPPIHLNFFTVESLINISSLYGFEIVFCKAKKFPYFIWNKFSTYKNFLKGILGVYEGPTINGIIQLK